MSSPQVNPLKYSSLISKSQEEINSQENQFATKEAELQLESDILATSREIAGQERKVLAAKAAKSFNSQTILDAQKKLEGLQEGLKRLQELKAELF